MAQLNRAVTSIPANVAEGQGRLSSGDFARLLAIARGSLGEVETLLLVTERLDLVAPERLIRPLSNADEISRMLSSLITTVNRR